MEQLQQSDAYERQNLDPECPCFIIIRFPMSVVQAAKNALTKWMSVHNNYSGIVSGVSGKVQCVEGFWEEHKGISVLFFDRVDEAMRWHDSVPEIRQQDWLGGIDMVIVPACAETMMAMKRSGADPRRVIQLMELRFHDYDRFERDYSDDAREILSRHGAAQIIGTQKLRKLKGGWDPEYLVMNAWETVDCFDKAYYGDDNKHLMEKRQSCAEASSCIFEMEPLVPRRR